MNTLLIYHLMVHDYVLCSLGRDPIGLLKNNCHTFVSNVVCERGAIFVTELF